MQILDIIPVIVGIIARIEPATSQGWREGICVETNIRLMLIVSITSSLSFFLFFLEVVILFIFLLNSDYNDCLQLWISFWKKMDLSHLTNIRDLEWFLEISHSWTPDFGMISVITKYQRSFCWSYAWMVHKSKLNFPLSKIKYL